MLLLNLMFLPNQNKVYAADCGMSPAEGYDYAGDGCSTAPILTPTEDFTIEIGDTPTASLSIDNKTSVTDKINSSYGITNYASHTVSVDVTGAASYELILSGPAKLSGPSTINATAGATGANLANDTWGYAWENTNVTDPNANYKALNSNIKLSVNALSNQAASFSKKLAFAAKFDKANAGTYHADVNLSLVVTPVAATTITANAVPWNKLVFMQDMTEYACMQAEIGDTKTLKDVREQEGKNTYTIAKLSDGRCWMTQNLRLSKETVKKYGIATITVPITLYNTDTNLETGYYDLPTSTTGAFSDTKDSNGFYTNQQVRASTDNDYGAYYSYNVATAGTAKTLTSDNAAQDICPKGWRLPTGGENGEFQALYDSYPTPTGYVTVNNKKGYWLGGTSISTGGAFFPAAGNMGTGGTSVQDAGYAGFYWSSTIYDAEDAYRLIFFNSGFYPISHISRYYGNSVRCIAK